MMASSIARHSFLSQEIKNSFSSFCHRREFSNSFAAMLEAFEMWHLLIFKIFLINLFGIKIQIGKFPLDDCGVLFKALQYQEGIKG